MRGSPVWFKIVYSVSTFDLRGRLADGASKVALRRSDRLVMPNAPFVQLAFPPVK